MIRLKKITNLKEWEKNALSLQKCCLKILNTLENKNISKKISSQEIIQKVLNLNKIFPYLKLIIKKIDNSFRSRNSMSECRKQEKIS
jgi:U3 small nucleolar ribonucleoprotein component